MGSLADIELAFYEKFFLEPGLEPYPVQEEAVGRIFAGDSVLVTVPTGTGKTLIAKAGISRALGLNQTAIYTTPLRALTEEKYRELCDDFGEDKVGFATGDYKVNPEAPVQVLVAEILWNRIYGDQNVAPADIVIMDEGHYFNDPERGYVWEQSIIGLHPRSQLVILSATVGFAQQFCQWVYLTRGVDMKLVQSTQRTVPLFHQFREDYLIEVVKDLFAKGEYPAIIFNFSRAQSFERARLLRSCPRFTTEEEQRQIAEIAAPVLLPTGLGPDLKKLLEHGVGVHHAGVLPAYRRLVETLTVSRLLKFVVTTETIAAGINLPAKRVVFPSLRKFVRGKARLLFPAEYHQMAGRAGRPQFDTEGVAITLAPDEVVQEFRKEIRDLKKRGGLVDEAKIKKKYYARAKSEARAKNDVTWDDEAFQKLVEGQPAGLVSRTQITPEQILAIGLPDLCEQTLPGQALIKDKDQDEAVPEAVGAPPGSSSAGTSGSSTLLNFGDDGALVTPTLNSQDGRPIGVGASVLAEGRRLDILTVIDHLLLPGDRKREAHRRLAMITRNLQALGVLDAHGRQLTGHMIGQIRGVDGVFVFYCLSEHNLEPELVGPLVEFLVDHDAIQRIHDRKALAKAKEWIRERLRLLRRDNPLATFEDAEAEYWREHPRELTPIELIHQAFCQKLPHPELHGGKTNKAIWAEMQSDDLTFLDYVQRHGLAEEEGQLFTYLARVMNTARMLFEVTKMAEFDALQGRVRARLAAVDERVLQGLF
ncbi:MAG: DEAD/DEAH box helicase [Deltaproteobacteria bacterium]|nr:DEAD/DEAH box helicase [Deltaproteobacteria bacterium]